YGSRADRIHTNSVWRDLLRDALHHQHHATFARGIVHVAGPWDDFVHTAHANDFACGTGNLLADPAPLEFTNRFARAEELACKVHVEDELPIRERHFIDRRVLLQAGIVDEDVNRAELLNHLFEHRLDLVLLCDIGTMSEAVSAISRDLIDDFFSGLRPGYIIYNDIRAGVCE